MTRKEIKEMKKRWREALATPTKPLHDPVSLGEIIDKYIEGKEYEDGKPDVLDKIRAEIEHLTITEGGEDYVRTMAELYSLKIKVLQIIDKYRTEREDKK